ncbi:MAG TPA: 50S ribosomal protein L5 [Candidatus Methanoculleus thermohydrogenotrophicum]|jgi:large subunit ribosomal protein L5|nr:50S ribosomal protein L5 [Candidatus Methanoculleus thermohydrogenotrophicum]NLM81701.1 50S ribosomal protein L5 [Candidatus Methanoculleus thermohydrogenotrophicum]HOB17841.1 50S ribosomal protein L5 [Candidatus Methanoculleus thermohydrogenotrophicum]HPZ37388.1 50S ribosomal protein L5 [Candidatus Methanoculleus thermohydrogenotrophicum]HQC91260.1 50S ribosomal protein L5 [Candidatus Methanoculleus thermohydrogenotrophicum]
MSAMREIYIDKVIVHMGVGESGERLVKAEELVKQITGQKPVRTIAKRTQPAFGIRKGAPIGCKVTLRRKNAEKFVETALDIIDRHLAVSQFDQTGNVSFGIEEHTDFPGMAYDPAIGIYGMDVNVVLERKGVRVARRAAGRRKLPADQRVNKEEAIAFMRERYQVEV